MPKRWEGRLHIVGGEDGMVLLGLWVEARLTGLGVQHDDIRQEITTWLEALLGLVGTLLGNLAELKVGSRGHDLSVCVPEAKWANFSWRPNTSLGIFGLRTFGKKREEAVVELQGNRVACKQVNHEIVQHC